MTPPPSHTDAITRRNSQLADEDLRRIRWAGWSLLGVVVCSWAGWLTLLAISHSSEIALVRDREDRHFIALQKQLDEIRSDVKQLLQRGARNVSD